MFTPYDPSFYGIFWGHIFCANMGGGGGQNCFHSISGWVGSRLWSKSAPFCLLLAQSTEKLDCLAICKHTSSQPCMKCKFSSLNIVKAFCLFLGCNLKFIQGELKVTDLRWQRKPKTQIFAENRRFSQIHPFSWKLKHLEGAGNRRKPQMFAEKRRKPLIGLRHLRSVTFSSALILSKNSAFSLAVTRTAKIV